jgi:UDP-N-acetylglucosamine--N-acetylmuramyl-(pentapeptide) pyrophosphoryl-undecaprenol N-acetylglucosamine transferase
MVESHPVCLIAAGGTAGHVLPALAVAEALRARGVGVTFAGSPGRFEAKLAPEAGFEFDTFEISGLPRRPGAAQLRAAIRSVGAVRACRRILKRRRPDVVLGGGGYVAGPMTLAAAGQRIPTALMEADAHLGLANRLSAPFARRIFLSFPIPGRTGAKYRLTGRPIPDASRVKVSREEARAHFFIERGPVLLVFGGSQGARSLNELAAESFGVAGPAVLHLSGERDFDSLGKRVARPDYRLLPFVPDFGTALAAADLVLARAGGSVWEIAAAERPAILVPFPFATTDHQTKNARYFEQAGGAVVIPETDLGLVPALARSLLGDPERLAEMAAGMRRIARPNAADEIAEEVIALAAAGR